MGGAKLGGDNLSRPLKLSFGLGIKLKFWFFKLKVCITLRAKEFVSITRVCFGRIIIVVENFVAGSA